MKTEILPPIRYSLLQFFPLVLSDSLHLEKKRIEKIYRLGTYGDYEIFRETVNTRMIRRGDIVLVVGFQLRLLGSSSFWHRIFQRLCILTTPFWSGFPGFVIKLWMVGTQQKKYLGIYQWQGVRNATAYAETLRRILTPLSTPGSVWYTVYPGLKLDTYLHRLPSSLDYDVT